MKLSKATLSSIQRRNNHRYCSGFMTNNNGNINPNHSNRNAHQFQSHRTIVGIIPPLDRKIYNFSKTLMPPISQTEQTALGCVTIGFDRDIFSGSPSLQHLVETYQPKLSKEEQSFLDNQVSTLCSLLNDHNVSLRERLYEGSMGLYER